MFPIPGSPGKGLMSSEMLTLLTTFSCKRKKYKEAQNRGKPIPEPGRSKGVFEEKQTVFQAVSKYRVSETTQGHMNFRGKKKVAQRNSFLDPKT